MYNISPFRDLKRIRQHYALPSMENVNDEYYESLILCFAPKVDKRCKKVKDPQRKYDQVKSIYVAKLAELTFRYKKTAVFVGRFRTLMTAELEREFPNINFIYGERL